jgi:hypothetical protein
MNEFADQGHQPPDDPRVPLVPARPAESPHAAHPGGSSHAARPGRSPHAARPGGSPPPADTPVRVRIVWDAAIPRPVTRGLGQDARDWFRSLMSPGPGPRGLRDVQYAEFTLSAGGGFVVDSPALPQIAVGKTADVINVLLVPARSDPFPLRPYHDMGPGSPVRKPGSDIGP